MDFPHFHKRHQHFKGFGRRGPFGGGPWDEEGGGRKRQPRGDIKYVLLELVGEQPRHGYELIKILEERSGGFYRPSPGVVYPSLQLLEEEGNLTSQVIEGKKIYTITDAGRKELEQRGAEVMRGPGMEHGAHPFGGRGGRWGGRGPGMNIPQLMVLRQMSTALFESVMQVARYGTPEQIEAAQAILKKANQDVHAILANAEQPKKF